MSAPDHAHHPHLAHHFESMEQQHESSKLGMWLFLATEILFFGGLFCAYAVYRANHPEVFLFAHHFLDKNLGAVNTVILICSSFTMAWAVRAAQLGQRRILLAMLALTLLFAGGFLGVKYVEYSHKWHHGLLWASKYAPDEHAMAMVPGGGHAEEGGERAGTTDAGTAVGDASAAADPGADAGTIRSNFAPAATGPSGLADADGADGAATGHLEVEPQNARTFFSIYFMMTGLHGIHVVLGMAAMVWLMVLAARGAFDTGHATRVDTIGLYWHLVDLIWIYLFLLLYLIH